MTQVVYYNLVGQTWLLSGTIAPDIAPGVNAPIGSSFAHLATGLLWAKVGLADTNWIIGAPGPPGPVGPTGPTGATGPAGGAQEDVVAVNFSFATASPMILTALAIGQIVDRACVLIKTAFDGIAPTLQLGTFANPGAILGVTEINAKALGQYESDVLFPVAVADFLILTITPSTSTVGDGILFYKLKI